MYRLKHYQKLAWLGCFFSSMVVAAEPNDSSSILGPKNVALVINDADATSVKAGEYYRVARGIPDRNIIHVNIPNAPRKLSVAAFTELKKEISSKLNADEQVILLAWTAPYAVECNSITAALSLGYDAEQCKKTCDPGKPNPYFDSASKSPLADHGIRLAMLLPTDNFERARKVIDRGVQSDTGVFHATAYYLRTSDVNRSSRAPFFPPNGLNIPRSGLDVVNLQSDQLVGASDVMIYQTGLPWVKDLDTLTFMPGALADHLTSVGGDLYGNSQMSILKWLDMGATASFGTVSEPCNYWQKFPNPLVLLKWYVQGATAVEAYWKSVAWPAQGLLIGEPLASPYRH